MAVVAVPLSRDMKNDGPVVPMLQVEDNLTVQKFKMLKGLLPV